MKQRCIKKFGIKNFGIKNAGIGRFGIKNAGIGKLFAGAVLLAASLPALAHPGHAEMGFADGLLHPLTGFDHLLALLAAGIWSVRQGRDEGIFRRSGSAHPLTLPAVFVAMMGAGAAAGMAGLQIPGLESGIALTVMLTGVLVAAAVRLPAVAGAALLGGFAVLHGNAHGLELPHAVSAAGYLGMSALLLGAGRLAGRLPLARLAGGAIAAAGLGMLALG
ncbi:HupE/UreJ family protein [Pseudoduganella umbonata]|uniref:HupE/UreJ family protein n=1 Tax=Pseudoduganella umbonata TaxID=864828 RepID=A0A4P8HKP1_9BURK|nr:HupE/UreJ family protein [Pseudoduganella umbonata]MBB3219372.1 urease accessory protein [Pseudoduganella umbonata]QCP09466.1 HupE/UreJ family protein [Pseudoduganella umbonata]